MTAAAVQAELDVIASVVSAMRAAPPAVRRRLCRGVNALLASVDGRYLEQLDAHLSALEAFSDNLKEGVISAGGCGAALSR
jgi:hypothetical protein